MRCGLGTHGAQSGVFLGIQVELRTTLAARNMEEGFKEVGFFAPLGGADAHHGGKPLTLDLHIVFWEKTVNLAQHTFVEEVHGDGHLLLLVIVTEDAVIGLGAPETFDHQKALLVLERLAPIPLRQYPQEIPEIFLLWARDPSSLFLTDWTTSI